MGHPLRLFVRDPSHYNLTLREIDFKTWERFDTKQKEFQIGEAIIIKFHQNYSIIRILEMRDAIRDEMRAHRSDMTSQGSSRENAR